MTGEPPSRVHAADWPPGAALFAGLLIGAAAGAALGLTPVGAAVGVGAGALLDWLRHRPPAEDEAQGSPHAGSERDMDEG